MFHSFAGKKIDFANKHIVSQQILQISDSKTEKNKRLKIDINEVESILSSDWTHI